MPLTDKFATLDPSLVVVRRDERQRRDIDTQGLEQSIKMIGQLQPIIIDRDMVLKAGERRLQSCKNLGIQVRVRYVEDLTPIESQIIELEENLKRKDLEWKEIIRATGEIHTLYSQMQSEWTATDTGEQLSLTQGAMSMYLRIWAEFDDPVIQAASGIREAYARLKRRDQRAAGDAMEDLLGVASDVMEPQAPPQSSDPDEPNLPTPQGAGITVRVPPPPPPKQPEVILNQSFLDWAPSYRGAKFNLVHCDFPYGIDLFAGPQGRGNEPGQLYADDEDVYWKLLDCFCQNLDNFMSLSAHLMFWYSGKHHTRTMATFAEKAPSLVFTRYPLIWHKTDNAGIASDVRFIPRHVYETCLLARRSDRQLLRIKSDVYACPTDKKLHISTKPEPMLREFMAMVCDETTSLFDPTCGSGAALRAGDSLGAKRLLGLEIDPKCCEVARQAFRNSRLLRGASSTQRERVDA